MSILPALNGSTQLAVSQLPHSETAGGKVNRNNCYVMVTGMRRMGSVKSRKVSTQSLQSTASAEDSVLSTFVVNFDDAAAASAPGPDTPCDEAQDTQADLRDVGDELDYCHNMPWIKVMCYGTLQF